MIKKSKVKGKTIILCFFLQFTALAEMVILANTLATITGQEVSTELNSLTPFMMFMPIVFNPIIEGFVFRKLFADKLLQYGKLL